MSDQKTLLEFPCQFPIKIIGKNTETFSAEMKDIILRHFPDTPVSNIVCKESQQSHYLSITATVNAKDQPTLDALYQDLTKHPDIKMVL